MVEVAGSRIKLVKGGSGDPLLVLHDEMGHPGWLRWHEALAQNHTLYIPWHPGFGESAELDWVMNLHDLAIWYLGALDDLGLEGVDAIGFSPGRLAGRGNGGDVPAAVQAAGPGRRRRRPAPHWRNLRHLPGGSQGLHQTAACWTRQQLRSSRPSAPTSPRRSSRKTGRRRWRVPAG